MYKRIGKQPKKYPKVDIDYENQVCSKCGVKMHRPIRRQNPVCIPCQTKRRIEYSRAKAMKRKGKKLSTP